MKTLVIILIVVLIVQTIVFIYCDLWQMLRNKDGELTAETLKNLQEDFMKEKQRFQMLLDDRDDRIKELGNKLARAYDTINYLEHREQFLDRISKDELTDSKPHAKFDDL